MKRPFSSVQTATTLLLLLLAPAQLFSATGAKNVILVIADGGSFENFLAATYYRHGEAGTEQIDSSAWTRTAMTTKGNDNPTYNPATAWLNYDMVLSYATSSAQAGTTLATGVKSFRENVNLNESGADISSQTLTAIADREGRATGIVSTVYFSHATPAVFGMASNTRRDNYTDIAQDIIQNTVLDLVLVPGHPYFDEDANPVTLNQRMYDRGGQQMYLDLIDGTNTRGWTVFDTTAELEALKTGTHSGRIFGVAPVGESLHYRRAGAAKWNSNAVEPYEIPFNSGIPHLTDLAEGALNVLSQHEDGFFVMIEAAAIDWAGHDQDKARMIETSVGMLETVDLVIDWVENYSSWEETLVVVTSDHDCGLIFGPDSQRDGGNEFQPIVNNGAGVRPGFRFNTGAHSNALVPVFARGPNQERFLDFATRTDTVRGGYIDISEVFPVINEALTAETVAPSTTYKDWLEDQGLDLDTPDAKIREDYLGDGKKNIVPYFFATPLDSNDRSHYPKAIKTTDAVAISYTYLPETGILPEYEGSTDASTWSAMEEGTDFSIISEVTNPDGTVTRVIELTSGQPIRLFRIALR